ncbi:MAG TPA: hypothetical protein QF720_03675 [Nitrospinota bacterium]|nr:hypothetical protein [Nitrospinota bacterium]|tara:strand:- start:26822 stop:27433 length:612 start_codon:yes stop_codon:yes gene_type:complete
MRYLKESDLLEILPSLGIIVGKDGQKLHMNSSRILGFDITNLQSIKEDAYYEMIEAGDRNVEYVMVSTVVKLLDTLSLFPVYLYAIDNEWLDEEIAPLLANNMLTKEEADVLTDIQQEGKGMDVIIIEHTSIQQMVRILVPQMTVFSKRCYLLDSMGRVLISFSADDEISFDTNDQKVYDKARESLLKLTNTPFNIIWAEDYT